MVTNLVPNASAQTNETSSVSNVADVGNDFHSFKVVPSLSGEPGINSGYQSILFAGPIGVTGSADGRGSIARFNQPNGVAVDGSGSVYVADKRNYTIRKITSAGEVATLAGSAGAAGNSDGMGSAARFNQPYGVAADRSGYVYVADTYNGTIRKITPDGVVTTLAGSPGVLGFENGVGAAAQFNAPIDVAVDGSGNVYVADVINCVIRKITPAGVVSTLAGSPGVPGSADGVGGVAQFNFPQGLAVDGGGNVYVADNSNRTIRKVTTAGLVSTLAGTPGMQGSADGIGITAQFDRPKGIAVDGSGNVYVADSDDNTLRKITSDGVVTTLAGRADYLSISIDGIGSAAQFNLPQGLTVDGSGNLYVADAGSHTIRKVTSGGVVTTFAGSPVNYGSTDGARLLARFNQPAGVAVDGSGNFYVADHVNCTIRKITSSGMATTLAGSPGVWSFADGIGGMAKFNGPSAVAVDGRSNVYVTDKNNLSIRKITPAGVVSTLAGRPGDYGHTDGPGGVARFESPQAIAVDSSGNLYIVDGDTIRTITPAGVVGTLAGSPGVQGSADGIGNSALFNSPAGIAVDGSGNVYVADSDNDTIRRITPSGVVTTIAGHPNVLPPDSADGIGNAAQFSWPQGIAVDAGGNIFVADYESGYLRKIDHAGVVSTLVSGSGSVLRFNNPLGLAVDAGGNLYVSNDQDNNIALVRRLGSPSVTIGPATDISPASATLNGTVNPNGFPTTAKFEYGQTTSYGTKVNVTLSPNNDSTVQNVSATLGGLQPSTTYHYRLNATNIQGGGIGNDLTFTTVASVPPSITIQPVNLVQIEGYNASFSVAAAGTLPLSYQWLFNGASLVGTTNSDFAITNVQTNHSGGYSVVVINSYGSVTSIIANLTVFPSAQALGTVTAWGSQDSGQTTVPSRLSNAVAVAAGGNHSLALQADGTVAAWGDNSFGQTNVPTGLSNVVAVAAGRSFSLALRANGTVAVWGDNSFDRQTRTAGLSNVVAIAAGSDDSLALLADGTVAAWGNNTGQWSVPAGLSNVIAIASGLSHSLALTDDGRVAAWGYNASGQTNVPMGLSNVVAVAAGWSHSLALRADGTVVAWGKYWSGFGETPMTVPADLNHVVAVAAGGYHCLALTDDGRVAAWGGNASGQTYVPAGLSNVVAIAAGGNFSLALINEVPSPVQIVRQPWGQVGFTGMSASFFVLARGIPPLHFQWRFNGIDIGGATNTAYTVTDVQSSRLGEYSVVVTCGKASVASQAAKLTLYDYGTPWARRVSRTSLADDELALGLATDSVGSIYVTGWFDYINDFGGTTLTSYGGQDAFVAKYNPAGELQWVRQAGGMDPDNRQYGFWDTARGVGVDGLGNVFVTGGLFGTPYAKLSETTLTIKNWQDPFLAKYNSSGTLQWVRQGTNSSHGAYGTGLAVDSVGNSLMVGYFDASIVSFGSVTATNPSLSGSYATFIVKHDGKGNALWARGLGGGQTYSTTVGMDAAGNCFVAGSFQGTLELGGTNLTSSGNKDGFLAKFNSAGEPQWVRQVAGTGVDGGRLGVDAAGNSWFVGNFTGSASIGSTNLSSPSGYGLFVARYDTDGNLLWVSQADSAGFLGTEGGCAIDRAGNCYIPGIYSDTVNFAGTAITNRGGWDFFVAKYDGAGNFQWAQTGGGTGNDGAFNLVVDAAGICSMAGWFQGTAEIGTNTLTAQGYWDIFLARINQQTQPPLQFITGSMSVPNGSFQVRLDGLPGTSVVVEQSFNLTSWTPMQTNTLPSGGLNLSMPMGTNRQQYYRARISSP